MWHHRPSARSKQHCSASGHLLVTLSAALPPTSSTTNALATASGGADSAGRAQTLVVVLYRPPRTGARSGCPSLSQSKTTVQVSCSPKGRIPLSLKCMPHNSLCMRHYHYPYLRLFWKPKINRSTALSTFLAFSRPLSCASSRLEASSRRMQIRFLAPDSETVFIKTHRLTLTDLNS
ncbi:hypothetical protein B0H16DRAFT_995560 [Mycena metata]|uniref:Uncharacterized protein n=1 Tax=Mycena metata TaxID=1033252 RepID=A0AAD7ILT9_9AGAR|nr:hypothetical protein B0H16DRAFT_995560 [Mycena metata]